MNFDSSLHFTGEEARAQGPILCLKFHGSKQLYWIEIQNLPSARHSRILRYKMKPHLQEAHSQLREKMKISKKWVSMCTWKWEPGDVDSNPSARHHCSYWVSFRLQISEMSLHTCKQAHIAMWLLSHAETSVLQHLDAIWKVNMCLERF